MLAKDGDEGKEKAMLYLLKFWKDAALKVLKTEQHLCSLSALFSVWFPTICPPFSHLFLCEWQMI